MAAQQRLGLLPYRRRRPDFVNPTDPVPDGEIVGRITADQPALRFPEKFILCLAFSNCRF